MGEIESIEVTARWWRRHVESSIPTISRAITELVVNSVDSYKRMNSRGKIVIEYDPRSFTCTVTDNAEGMSREKLKEVLKRYGGLTSGINSGKKVGGVFGVGLKEVCMRMEEGIITTIKDGKLTQRRVFKQNGEPKTEEIIFRNAIKSDRNVYDITENGTQIELKLAKDLRMKSEAKPQRLINRILDEWILRKILQNQRYEIIFIDRSKGDFEVKLQIPHLDEKNIILGNAYNINYHDEEFKINIKIFKLSEADSELFKDGPLIAIYNEDVVAERSLIPEITNDLIAANLRGEVYIDGFEKLLSRDEPVLDEKRTGMDMRHAFNQSLVKLVKPIVKAIIKQSRSNIQKPNFDTSSLIANLNNIAKQELEEIDTEALPRNFRPKNDAIGFYYSREINLKENEEKSVFLVINSDKISEDVKLFVKSESGKTPINITPSKINLTVFKTKKDLDPDLKYSKIKLTGIEPGSATITAEANRHTANLVATVKHNEILDIKEMAFLPNKYDFDVNKNYGYIFLYIRKDSLTKDTDFITFKVSMNKGAIKTIKRIYVNKMPNFTNDILYSKIKVTYDAKVGDQENISAEYSQYVATAIVSIVEPNTKNPKGLFAEIRDEYNEASDEIARIGEDRIIYVNKSHPILQHYSSRDAGEKSAPYMAMYSDAVARVVCRKIVNEKFTKNQLSIPDISDPNVIRASIDNEIDKLYKRYGTKIHEWILNSAGTLYTTY